jgi:hypothetical protein
MGSSCGTFLPISGKDGYAMSSLQQFERQALPPPGSSRPCGLLVEPLALPLHVLRLAFLVRSPLANAIAASVAAQACTPDRGSHRSTCRIGGPARSNAAIAQSGLEQIPRHVTGAQPALRRMRPDNSGHSELRSAAHSCIHRLDSSSAAIPVPAALRARRAPCRTALGCNQD